MVQPAVRPQGAPAGVHLVLYDGVCGLCNRLVQFLLQHDHQRVFSFASLQSAVGQTIAARSGGNSDDLNTFYVIADYQKSASRVLTRSDAGLFVLGTLGWPWKAASVMWLVPKGLRDRAYDAVARHRYRWFGRYDSCLVPDQEYRGRFID